MAELSTPLQDALVRRIIDLVHEEQLGPGDRLKESQLAERLNVSRSPIRAALSRLAADGFAEHQPNRGMILVATPPRAAESDGQAPSEDLLVAIARLRREGQLDSQFAEAELIRMTGADRARVRQALTTLEGLGAVHRRSGYGWEFSVAARDSAARAESFRFRILIECAAILEPGFHLEQAWIDEMRERHQQMMRAEWTDRSSVILFEMNAEFHQGISAASGNRYIADAMQRQNQLRRLSNYNWKHGPGRVAITCTEHLEILGRLESGDYEVASALMRSHLTGASRLLAVPDVDN